MEIIKSFNNTRIQLLCSATEKTTFGWIIPTSMPYLLVNIDQFELGAINTVYTALVSAAVGSGSFKTLYRGVVDGRHAFDLPSVLRLDHGGNHEFFKLTSGTGTIANSQNQAKLISIGNKELNIELTSPVKAGEKHLLHLSTTQGNLELSIVVKSCESNEVTQTFITEIKIESMGRIDEGRWAKLIAS